jgi:hypothetical protein
LSKTAKSFCFNEQGTGKTASVIWAVDYLMQLGVVKRVLVICPLSIMKSAWQQDLFKFAIHRTVSVAYGSAKKRKEIVNAGIGVCRHQLRWCRYRQEASCSTVVLI